MEIYIFHHAFDIAEKKTRLSWREIRGKRRNLL